MKGDEGVAGWDVLSAFPNVKAVLGWPNPDPDEPNANPVDGLDFSSNFPPKGLESPDVVPKLNGEFALLLPWPKSSTRPPKNGSSFGREVATSKGLVGLSSILTSSSSLGGVTGRGKLPSSGFCVSVVLELVVNVKIPELDGPCVVPPNCGAAGFSGEETPNLKANGNAGFTSSLGKTTGGLTDSPRDGVGVGCSTVNGFELSAGLVAPSPVNGVPDEPPNENAGVVSSFCSELVTVGVGSTVEATVEAPVDSTTLSWDVKPPNKLGGG